MAGFLSLAGLYWISANLIPGALLKTDKSNFSKQELRALTKNRSLSNLKSIDFINLLGNLTDLGLNKEAILLLENLIIKDPENPSWRLMLAKLYLDSKEFLKAKENVDLLITIFPENMAVLELKVLISLNRGEGQEAVAFLQEIFDRKQDDQRLLQGLLLADAMLVSEMNDKAEKVYLKLANEYPLDSEPVLGLALLKKNQGDLLEAHTLLRKARQLRTQPDQPDELIDEIATKWKILSLQQNPY